MQSKKWNTAIGKILIGVAVILFYSFSSPIKSGIKIFKLLQKGKIEKLEKYYLQKSDFINFVNSMDRKPPQAMLDRMLETYEEDKETYLMGFNKDGLVGHKQMRIDRIEYDYQIGKPGKDEKITWPDSQAYEPKNSGSEQLKVNMTFYLEEGNQKYLMTLEMMNYKGKWKLFHALKPIFITKME